MSHPKPLLYNPDQKPKQQLIDEFVIRQKEYTSLMNGIADASPQTSPQHYLVVGQRGMGKTTLLLRVKYAIEDHPQLKNWLIPIRFSEEQYQIARLDRLWEEIAEHLEMANPLFDGLLQEMQQHEESEGYDRIALDVLVKTLKKHKKRVLVMVDNLGDLFNKFSDEENHRLREVLLGKIEIQLMGASSSVLEHTFRYDKPFYEFFQQITLQPINKGSSFQLLEALGKQYGQEDKVSQLIQENPAKIEVLRRLTGGVPRTMALLFGIFIDHQQGTTFEDLRLLLDGVNSLYKHRMDEMKPQQQQIVDALAKAWDPISSSEVLQRSKLNRENIATNQISAQLKVLADNQIVEALSGTGKNKTYRIRERFFNIWYLMRYGKRQQREEVLWLVRFLETWCTTKEELMLQADEHMQALQRGNYSTQAAYLKTMALCHVKGLEPGQRLQLLEHAETYLKGSSEETNARAITNAKRQELDQWMKRIVEKVERQEDISIDNDLPNGSPEASIYIINFVVAKLYKLGKPLMQIEKLLEKGIQLGSALSMALLGSIYHSTDPDSAEKYNLMAVKKGNREALYNLALLYEDKNDFELSEKYYLMAIEEGIIYAMNNLALLYSKKGNFDSAEKYFLMAIENDDLNSISNLAALYHQNKNDFELAEKYYLMAIENGNTDALNNLAWTYHKNKNDFELAEKYYMMAVEKGNIYAMFNLATLYEEMRNLNSAKKYYLMAVEKGDLDATNNLAVLYHREKDFELAEKYYLMVVERGDTDAMSNLALMYDENMHKQLAEKYFHLAHFSGNIKASINLIVFYSENNRTNDMLQVASELFVRTELFENEKDIFKLLYHILLKKQYHFLLQQFRKPEIRLMQHARPYYYVLAWFMRDELPGEYEKAGAEIKETVDEIIQVIEQKHKEGEFKQTE